MAIKYGNPDEIASIKEAVAYFPNSDFQSIDNAAIPLLSFLIHDYGSFQRTIEGMGFRDDYDVLLKCPVPPLIGQGKPSTSDLILKSPTQSASLESLWSENFGSSVGSWLNAAKHDEIENRRSVLQGWLRYLDKQMQQVPAIDAIENVNYRMLHRAASAASKSMNPNLIYLLFTSGQDDRNIERCKSRLANLKTALSLKERFGVYLVWVETIPTEHFNQFKDQKSGSETAGLMRMALQEPERLFNFSEPKVIRIGCE